MKKIIFAFFAAFLLFAFSGCELFRTELKYSISGPSTSVTISYTTKSGTLEDGTVASPWEYTSTLYSGDKPFLAFMQVTNNGAAAVQAAIYENDQEAITPITVNPGAIGQILVRID